MIEALHHGRQNDSLRKCLLVSLVQVKPVLLLVRWWHGLSHLFIFDVVTVLEALFVAFDEIAMRRGVYKIETIGGKASCGSIM